MHDHVWQIVPYGTPLIPIRVSSRNFFLGGGGGGGGKLMDHGAVGEGRVGFIIGNILGGKLGPFGAVNNHWTGLLDWTTNLTTRFQLRSKN